MSQLLTLELSDDVYAALKQQADAAGLSVAELIVISVVDGQHRLLSVTKLQPEVQSEEAYQRLFSYAGAISLGYATGIDNESIDADLAKAYANDF
ncbi:MULTISPECIES: hypothetical protein [unclassified Nostoc]|uniref:hypothetical protein n=1 Tax=unclassified Nostoc TaxID=2593658 RepID=UPI002AD31144|nr:hypothetical protein [Nostoc sp. DedQUE03]MDZ7975021.1 hypothetical protein [Nostoc sp. DedQUE03]MDZ8047788.1 hypothetical protein [Nostoc sp. DedQUE02]